MGVTGKAQSLGHISAPIGYKAKDLIPVHSLFSLEMIRRGWWFRAEIPWIVSNKMPGPWKNRPILGHEWVLMFTKTTNCSYNSDRVLVKYTKPIDRWCGDYLEATGNSEWSEETGQPYRSRDLRPNKDGRNRRTSDWFADSLDGTIEFYRDYLKYLEGIKSGNEELLVSDDGDPLALVVNNHPSSLKHFAMYNERLITPLIESCTEPGDTVLDPFGGTSTTGRVAIPMGRNYIGIEAKPEYAEIARKTLDEVANRPEQAAMF